RELRGLAHRADAPDEAVGLEEAGRGAREVERRAVRALGDNLAVVHRAGVREYLTYAEYLPEIAEAVDEYRLNVSVFLAVAL
ncbi:hypothetical protein AAHH78_35620, partial [Burkholderia pseudomallei]